MEICAPKDGFIIAMHVHEKMKVQVGQILFQIDGDDEDEDIERLKKMDAIRREIALQYEGEEHECNRALALIAVDLADYAVEVSKANLEIANDYQRTGGPLNGQDAQWALNVAKKDTRNSVRGKEKAALELKKFDFAVSRHKKINQIIADHTAKSLEVAQRRRDRLVITAPVAGVVTKIEAGVNSFRALGDLVLTID